MTPEQRYLFDIKGYLHIPKVLSDSELAAARAAIDRYMATPDDELPEGFSRSEDGKYYANGFAFDKALEALTMHLGLWSIVKELTHDQPAFTRGTLLVDSHLHEPFHLHCAREDYGWQSTRFDTREGRIFCDDFVIFPYFDDVFPGDGGLLVVPGSHKAEFERPPSLFNGGVITEHEDLPAGVVNVTPQAGDAVIMTEMLVHGTLQWKPEDRLRRTLVLRYRPQFKGQTAVPDVLQSRLSPQTKELMANAHYTHVKEIVKENVVRLT
ncbi:TPA: hypothetical protein EYN65_00545 [Candidatus Poribacteria bacterium]|nr:hypothetical protein [Candidatus Poribacteria bacterium]HIO77607.1 hypothetical protein [Candidatus Poribacteria bacterium]